MYTSKQDDEHPHHFYVGVTPQPPPPPPPGGEPQWKFALYAGTVTEASIVIISQRISFELINTVIYFKKNVII